MLERRSHVVTLVLLVGCFDPTKPPGAVEDSGSTSELDTSASTTLAMTSITSASATEATDSADAASSPTTTASSVDSSSDAGVDSSSSTSMGGPACGDGDMDPGEDCDDGDRVDGNGCNNDCLPSGRLLWCVLDGDTDEDTGTGVTADNLGNVYATGTLFREGIDDDVWVGGWAPDGTEIFTELYDISSGDYDRGYDLAYFGALDQLFVVAAQAGVVHLLRVDGDGALALDNTVVVVNASSVDPTAITVSPNGMYWTGTGNFSGSNELVLGKISNAGQPLWTVHDAQGPGGYPVASGVAADPLDDVYLAGTSAPQGFIHHHGALAGAIDIDVGGLPPLRGIAVAGNGELVVVGTTYVNGQGDDITVSRRSADGMTELWSVGLNGAANLDDVAGGVVVDADDRIVAAGAVVDAGTATTGLLAGIDGAGTVLWTTSFEPSPGYTGVADVTVDADGASSIVGTFFGDSGDGDILVCHFAR